MKRRCQELHEKLFHIKRLVVEYDNAHIANTWQMAVKSITQPKTKKKKICKSREILIW